ncbi:MAG TPA: hypothetical protein VGJ84_12775 [Polyangiaceae bacterium]|jgi:hypothetical protein
MAQVEPAEPAADKKVAPRAVSRHEERGIGESSERSWDIFGERPVEGGQASLDTRRSKSGTGLGLVLLGLIILAGGGLWLKRSGFRQPAQETAPRPAPTQPIEQPSGQAPSGVPTPADSASAAPSSATSLQAPPAPSAAGQASASASPTEITESLRPEDEKIIARALERAGECHKGGRASGTAQITLVIAPAGRVKDVQIQGEPIASAPVSRCIWAEMFSMQVPRFDGPPRTVKRSITLR